MGRVPTNKEVAALSRDDWEDACRKLASLLEGAEGVEDHLGKGNGLDALRIEPASVLGWQFRRLEDRYGDVQQQGLKANITSAATRALNELHRPLVRFDVWMNIDLEPGHAGKKGEIQRWDELVAWAKATHGIELVHHGLTWVSARLLDNPRVHPVLFEDVVSEVRTGTDHISAKIDAGTDHLSAKLDALAALLAHSPGRIEQLIATMVREATSHYKRGCDTQSLGQFISACRHLMDALNLLEQPNVDDLLRGRVLAILAGVEIRLGRLEDAEVHARRATHDLSIPGGGDELAFARGNLAHVLMLGKRFEESSQEYMHVLEYFRTKNDLPEVVKTLTHIFEASANIGDVDGMHRWSERLGVAVTDLDDTIGPTDITLAARAAIASGLIQIACGMDPVGVLLLRTAEQSLKEVEALAALAHWKHIELTARAQRAQSVRFQDRLHEAEELYRSTASEAGADLGKLANDSSFNRAIVLRELGRASDAVEAMDAVLSRYLAQGDQASAAEAREILDEWNGVR